MRLRDFAVVGIVAMVVFQIVTSFASINLLTRMSPAIERILSENVASNTAAEDMLVCLTRRDSEGERRKAFLDALTRARRNITEAQENSVLDAVERRMDAALAGDTEAVSLVGMSLHELAGINRMSMRRADEEAKRIGNRGAWAMAILGIVGFFAGVLVLHKIIRGVIAPVEEIRRVLDAQLKGDTSRRLFLKNVAPDFLEVSGLINRLLSHRIEKVHDSESDIHRLALLHLIDASDAPTALLSLKRETLAANRAMEKILRGDEKSAVKQLLSEISTVAAAPSGWRVTDLKGRALLVQKTA